MRKYSQNIQKGVPNFNTMRKLREIIDNLTSIKVEETNSKNMVYWYFIIHSTPPTLIYDKFQNDENEWKFFV